MQTEIIVALIGFVGAVVVALVSYLGNMAGAKSAATENRKLIEYRLDKLEEKMDKHNNLVERLTRLEGSVKVIEQDRKAS